jgi:metal transporter CNNM
MSIEWIRHLDTIVIGKHESEELPAWLFYTYLCVSIVCVCMAGLMSGLTLGFFSLDEIDLEVRRRAWLA